MTYDDLTTTWSEPALQVLAKITRQRDQARAIACELEQECARRDVLISDLQGQVVMMELELAGDDGGWPT